MVIDVSVVRPCMRQLNSDQSWIKELERSVASVAVGSGLRFTGRRVDKETLPSVDKIGCTGDWFMMKISATTSMQLLPTHKHKNISDEFLSTLYLLSSLFPVCS